LFGKCFSTDQSQSTLNVDPVRPLAAAATAPVPNTAVIQEKFPEIRTALTRSEEEIEAQIRAMKHLPPPQEERPPPPKRAGGKLLPSSTQRQETGLKMALPPVVVTEQRRAAGPGRRLHHQFEAQYDREADTEFYREFKFTFVCLPVPSDALPREYEKSHVLTT
jgi:hypothetical protein